MPREMLEQMTGYGPGVKKNRKEAQGLMRSLGYGPDNRLNVKVSTRNIAWYLDHATILIDQLKEIWIDGELDAVETANWVPKLLRKDFTVAQSLSGSAVDDPDTQFYKNYSCRSSRNYTGCNSEVDALIERRSAEIDPAKRKQMVWQIERKLIEDAVRPIIFFMRQGTCWQPEVKGLTLMDNSIFNSWRMEDGSTGELIEDHVLDETIRRLLVVCSRPAAGNVALARFGKNHWSATPLNPWFRRGVAWFLASLRA